MTTVDFLCFQVIFLSVVCPFLFGLRSFMAFQGATPPLHPLHILPEGTPPPLTVAGQVGRHRVIDGHPYGLFLYQVYTAVGIPVPHVVANIFCTECVH